ncbi:hypothetical protein ACRRTK_019773 [Alexandromys fortis]
MAPLLRALAALPEGPGVIPSTHIAAHNCLTPVPEGSIPLLASVGTRRKYATQTYMQAKKNTHIYQMQTNCLLL